MAIIPPIGASGIAASRFSDLAQVGNAKNALGATNESDGDQSLGFGQAVINALDNLQAAHTATDQAAQAAATGDLQAVEDYMVLATETQLATQLTVAVRNNAVEAFNEIMRMQI